MPGLLSNIFDAGDDGGTSGSSQTYAADADQDTHLSPEITIETEMGGSYQELDGSTTTWSNSNDVTLNADVAVSTAASVVATVDEAEGF